MRRSISRKYSLSKKAQENSNDSGVLKKYLSDVLSTLRAQYINYQTSHWISKGTAFYSEHLMFQRLYKSVEDEIDTLAEKLVCFEDEESVDIISQTEKIHMLCKGWSEEECPLKRGLDSEQFVQKILQEAYEAITKSGEMTLGLDDFLMATANSHEENMYLLKRSLKK